MRVVIIDSDFSYSSAIMRHANKLLMDLQIDHYLTLKHVDGENSHFPTGNADAVLVSSSALGSNVNWSSKEALQEIFGSIPIIINIEKDDDTILSTSCSVPGELEFISKNKGYGDCLEKLYEARGIHIKSQFS